MNLSHRKFINKRIIIVSRLHFYSFLFFATQKMLYNICYFDVIYFFNNFVKVGR